VSNVIAKEMFKCSECNKSHDSYHQATRCFYEHAKEVALNADFQSGQYTLGSIWAIYGGFMKELPDELKNITKDNCFVVSYLQCCDSPAYQITHISGRGDITVGGDGSWNGYYSSTVGFHNLKDPRPLSELWKYSDSGTFGRNRK